jgi:preprotein translocase subunit SecY
VLSVFVRAFRTPDLRKKLLFSGVMIALFRFGASLPTPGISERNVSYCSGMSRSSGAEPPCLPSTPRGLSPSRPPRVARR